MDAILPLLRLTQTPCIIFIDEIDAIGRARSSAGGDPGSMERESALLALLVQMDGISGRTEKVCVKKGVTVQGPKGMAWSCL